MLKTFPKMLNYSFDLVTIMLSYPVEMKMTVCKSSLEFPNENLSEVVLEKQTGER